MIDNMTYILLRCTLNNKEYVNSRDKTLLFCDKSVFKVVNDEKGDEKYKLMYNFYEPGPNREDAGYEVHVSTIFDTGFKATRYVDAENDLATIEKAFEELHAYSVRA